MNSKSKIWQIVLLALLVLAIIAILFFNNKLNISGWNVRIFELRLALAHFSGRTDDKFVSNALRELETLSILRRNNQLDNPSKVPQIDKNQTSVVASRVHPSRDSYSFSKKFL